MSLTLKTKKNGATICPPEGLEDSPFNLNSIPLIYPLMSNQTFQGDQIYLD